MALPSPLYVLLQGGKFITILNAATQTDLDVVVNFGQTYRDEIWAQQLGRSPMEVVRYEDDPLTITSPNTFSNNGDLVSIALPTTTISYIVDDILLAMQESDAYTHTPPRYLEQTVTYVQWKDGSSALLYECMKSEIIGTSGQIPQYVGITPPAALTTTP